MATEKCQDITKSGQSCKKKVVYGCNYCALHLKAPTKYHENIIEPSIDLKNNFLSCLPFDIVSMLFKYLTNDQIVQYTDNIIQWKSLQNRPNFWQYLWQTTFSTILPDVKNLEKFFRECQFRFSNSINKLYMCTACNWEIACHTYLCKRFAEATDLLTLQNDILDIAKQAVNKNSLFHFKMVSAFVTVNERSIYLNWLLIYKFNHPNMNEDLMKYIIKEGFDQQYIRNMLNPTLMQIMANN